MGRHFVQQIGIAQNDGVLRVERESAHVKRAVEAKETSPLLPEISNDYIVPTRSSDALGLVDSRLARLYFFILWRNGGETAIPEDSMLLVPASVTSPAPALPAAHARAPSGELIPPFEVSRYFSSSVTPPIEVVPRQRDYSVVSIQRESEEVISSPDDVAVLMLPNPASVTLPAPSVHAEPSCALRWYHDDIAQMSSVRYQETARKQSKLPITPSEPAKAVVHVQERTNRRSSNHDNSVCRNLKSPPSRITASESKLRIGNMVISTRKLTSSLKHAPSAKETSSVLKPSPVSSIPATPSSQHRAKLNCSSPHDSKRRESRVVSTKPVVRNQKNEICYKVPEPAVNVRTESVIERSTSNYGPVETRVQNSLLPIEFGEKWRIYDPTVVNIQHIESEEVSSPDASVASTLSVPAPATSPVHPLQVESLRHSLDENKPPINLMVSRRHGLSVVNDRSTTVRRQSDPNDYPSIVSEGRYLASAAAYVQERKRRRSLDCDEAIRCAPKGPSDRSEAESASLRQALSVVRKETDASVNSCSPRHDPEDPEILPVQPEATLQHLNIRRTIELSTTWSNSLPHHPESTLGISHVEKGILRHLEAVNVEERVEGDPQDLELPNEVETQLRNHAVNNEETSGVSHSPPCVVLSPLCPSNPVRPVRQAYSTPQLESFMLQLNQSSVQSNVIPDCLDSSRRQVLDVVGEGVGISENLCSPALCTVPLSIFSSAFANPVLSLPTTQLNLQRSRVMNSTGPFDPDDILTTSSRWQLIPPIPKPVGCLVNILSRCESKELSWRARCKPPDSAVASRQRNNDVVNTNDNLSVSKLSPLIPPASKTL
ncbi:hypothetical protein F5887DRAFT_921045 [Amanita rubescens]|nr:hypothetical protein F5887DRAFT_921045 [Amanita rubescens]